MTRHGIHITRDAVLFVIGLAGVVYETIGDGPGRPALLAVFAGMIGLPVFLRLDSKQTAYQKEEAGD